MPVPPKTEPSTGMIPVKQATRIRGQTGGVKFSILVAESRVRNPDATVIAINVIRADHE